MIYRGTRIFINTKKQRYYFFLKGIRQFFPSLELCKEGIDKTEA